MPDPFPERQRKAKLAKARLMRDSLKEIGREDFKTRLAANGDDREAILAELSLIELSEDASQEVIDRFLALFPMSLAPEDWWRPEILEPFAPNYSRLASQKLEETDFVNLQAFERDIKQTTEWFDWREKLREIVNTGEGPIPKEPPRWGDETDQTRKRAAKPLAALEEPAASIPIPEDLNTPLVQFAEENGHGTGHGLETGEGGGAVDAGEDAPEDDPFDAEFEEASDEDGEPIPDALALMAPEGMPFDDLKEYFRQKQQALHHRLIDGGQSLPPLSFEEHEELNTLQKYIGWFN